MCKQEGQTLGVSMTIRQSSQKPKTSLERETPKKFFFPGLEYGKVVVILVKSRWWFGLTRLAVPQTVSE
jgi:hypothetical protein